MTWLVRSSSYIQYASIYCGLMCVMLSLYVILVVIMGACISLAKDKSSYARAQQDHADVLAEIFHADSLLLQ